MKKGYDRRTFLKNSLAATTGIAAGSGIMTKTASWASTPSTRPIPKRPLGKTGHQVSIMGLGGLYTPSMHDRHEDSLEIANRAIDLGINYIDTAPRYGSGASELNLGTVIADRRDEVFLATKSHDYTYDGTMAIVQQSLQRLQTDHVDLLQHHAVGIHGQLEELQKQNSARQAFEELRDQGVTRFLGVTGHSSRILADALEDYPYDCALITLNAAREIMDDPEDLERFFQVAADREVGVIAMKVVNRGALIEERGLDIRQLLPYVLSYPVSTAILGISEVPYLEEDVRIASAFEQLSEDEMAEIREIAQA